MNQKLNLRDYTWNIYEIDYKQGKGVDRSVAFSMFMNNVRHGKAIDFGTVCNWAELKKRWDAMTGEEQSKSRSDYFLTDDAPGLDAAYQAGDQVKFNQIIADYAKHLAEQAEAEKEAEE